MTAPKRILRLSEEDFGSLKGTPQFGRMWCLRFAVRKFEARKLIHHWCRENCQHLYHIGRYDAQVFFLSKSDAAMFVLWYESLEDST